MAEKSRIAGREVIRLEDGRDALVTFALMRPPVGWDARTRKSTVSFSFCPFPHPHRLAGFGATIH
jgi:hypothetical protein